MEEDPIQNILHGGDTRVAAAGQGMKLFPSGGKMRQSRYYSVAFYGV